MVFLTSLFISLTVNAVVTGLIVLRILQVYREASRSTHEDQALGTITGAGVKLRSLIFIILESGMLMFTVQLIRVILDILQIDFNAVSLVTTINQQLNVITRSVISTFHFTEIISRE